jgi:hypothetical protein
MPVYTSPLRGLHAAQLYRGDARLRKRSHDPVIHAVFLDGAAAVMHQGLMPAKPAHQLARLLLAAAPEGEERGGVKLEIFHAIRTSFQFFNAKACTGLQLEYTA